MVPLTELHLRAARRCIAAAVVAPSVPAVLGTIRLRDDQRASVGRVLSALARDRGCLLADDVGTGKTYVALAAARTWASPLVVVPASIRSTWHEAVSRAGVRCDIISHESLSRGWLPGGSYDGVIVDESHRFRSTSARRHAALATLCAHARVLLLSATPLQNRSRDLAAQIALFHGERAFELDPDSLARFVIRAHAGAAVHALPAVAAPVWVRPAADDGCVLQAILALPSPASPVDGGDAGALRTIGLVRAWASSRAALTSALRRRRRVTTAIEQCLSDGRLPTRAELSAWVGADSVVQLGFPAFLAASVTPAGSDVSIAVVEREQRALAHLLRAVSTCEDPDVARATVLREICAAHPQARVIAFTELASTARAYYALMAHQAGVGLLTANEARIASGRLPRDALLARFAPIARHAPAPPARERVTLLVTTDLLSEGVNLQDASVVVHLDLPWNPARLSQRVGRVRRPGGAALVHAYLMAPPASAEQLLDVEQRLRRKLARAAATIGRGFDVVPRLTRFHAADAPHGDGSATLRGATLARIARWRRPARRGDRRPPRPVVAAVASESIGWLAVSADGRIIAAPGGPQGDVAVEAAVRACDGPARALRPGEGASCLLQCQHLLDAERLARLCGREVTPSALATAVDRHIARALRHAPRCERARIAALGQRLRGLVRGPHALGVERALRVLLDHAQDPGDVDWMRAAHDLVARREPRVDGESESCIVALIVLGPGR